jgi:hypothetical protein
MSTEELVGAVEARDKTIQELQAKLKALEGKPKKRNADPKAAADKLRRAMAISGIKKQMKWKPTLKYKLGRWSWTSLCDEDTFKAFMGIPESEKGKGRNVKLDDFEELMGTYITRSNARYNSLPIKGEHVTITYIQDGQIRISGSYGKESL